MHSSFSVFCSVAVNLVTVYTIASYILSVHVHCINLYVYNIIFTAKKAPRKTAFYLFREANIFFICTKQEQKVCLNFSLLFISSSTLMTDFISAAASHPYLILVQCLFIQCQDILPNGLPGIYCNVSAFHGILCHLCKILIRNPCVR